MIAAFLLAAAVQIQEPVSGLTEPPITFMLDYSTNHLGNAEWLASIATAAPTLLQTGKDVPVTHNWGPIASLGGENTFPGLGADVAPITPEEVVQRIETLKEMVQKLHSSGVRMVMPYICATTVAGHDQRRSGFWAFYDQWVKYAKLLDLGLRPAPDPAAWMQRMPDGSFVRDYQSPGDFYPPYAPNHRYAACVNDPNWQHWLSRVITLIARCGYDGVYVENSATFRCFCTRCQHEFRDWAKKNKMAANDLIAAGTGNDEALQNQATRFWLESMHRHQLRLRTVGTKLNPNFKLLPNSGHDHLAEIKLSLADSDFAMLDQPAEERSSHPGLTHDGKLNHDIMELKFVQCLRKRARPMIVTRNAETGGQPQLDANSSTEALGCAEVAAFGNGGGCLIRPSWPSAAETTKSWRSFFERNADLYRSNDTLAAVGVACWSEQSLIGNSNHLAVVRAVTSSLLAAHVPFDYVVEENFTNNFIRRYPAMILPEITHADPKALDAAAKWAQAGGRLLLLGEHPADSPLNALERLPDGRRGPALRMAKLKEEPFENWLREVVHVDSLLPEDDRPELQHVFANVFARRNVETGDVRLTAHLVNYNVALGNDAPAPKPITDIMVRIPLPRDLKPRKVFSVCPESSETEALEWQPGESGLLVKLPKLGIYKMLVVDYESTTAPNKPAMR